MNPSQGAAVVSMREAEAAAWAVERGSRVRAHRGRHWLQPFAGFYQPVHLLQPVEPVTVSSPTPWCWGYRAVVATGDPADGRLDVYLLDDVPGYDESRLTRSRRSTLRRSRRVARYAALADAGVLRREGYAVMRSSLERTGHRRRPGPARYQRAVDRLDVGGRTTVVAASIDGRLVGYITGHVIEGTSYGEDLFVDPEGLAADVATGLVFGILRRYAESGVVACSSNGLVAAELTGLDAFKRSMGFRTEALAVRTHVARPAGLALARCTPARYARLVGRAGAAPGAPPAPAGDPRP